MDRLLCPVSIRIGPASGFGMCCCADNDASWKNSALQRHEHHREEDFRRHRTSAVAASPAPAAEPGSSIGESASCM